MKNIPIIVVLLILVGCSNSPSSDMIPASKAIDTLALEPIVGGSNAAYNLEDVIPPETVVQSLLMVVILCFTIIGFFIKVNQPKV